jgi:acetyl esterase/lipase
MKKLFTLFVAYAIATVGFAQRYVSEVFTNVTKTANITYANNISILTGTPTATDLKMDVYEPTGDTLVKRPLIVFLHTGSFLPAIFNGSPTGSRNDSATVEICTRFARRGYVVANVDYRIGWDALNANLDGRRGTLLSAVYRSIQDVKAAVRFMRKDAATSNTYKIDSNKVILGGQGSGGYIAFAYATLKDTAQIQLTKFISSSTIPNLGFVAGMPYVNHHILGDFNGYGGIPQLNNPNNSVGYGNSVQFVFNLGGAIGDSSWLTAGAAPMVSFHCIKDPFAPFMNGIVFVPGTNQSVVDVSGSGYVIPKAIALGNETCFNPNNFTDVYTNHANTLNGGADGLYPFMTASLEASPWEWFDSTATVLACQAVGKTVGYADTLYMNALFTNPNMSKTKAYAYIDTIMGYLNPRIEKCLHLNSAGINDLTIDNSVEIFPNPVAEYFTVRTQLTGNKIEKVELMDVTGRTLLLNEKINANQVTISRKSIVEGMYLVVVTTNKGVQMKKLLLQ